MSRYRGKHRDRSTRDALLGALIIPGLPFLYAILIVLAAYMLA